MLGVFRKVFDNTGTRMNFQLDFMEDTMPPNTYTHIYTHTHTVWQSQLTYMLPSLMTPLQTAMFHWPSTLPIHLLCLILQVKKLRLREVQWLFWDTCNWAGHFGAFPRQDFPHIFFVSSSLKYLDNRIWCTFPELFCRQETPRPQQMEELLDDYEHRAPGLLESKDWHC